MKIPVCIFLLLSLQNLYAQNLIPDHSFEEMPCPENSIQNFIYSPTWYAVNSDAYLSAPDCPVNEAVVNLVHGQNPLLRAYDGNQFVSFEGALSNNGFFFTEGVGIELIEPLKPGKNYYFEMSSLYMGMVRGFDHPSFFCNQPEDAQFLSIYFAEDTVSLRTTDTIIGTKVLKTGYNFNAQEVLRDNSWSDPDYEEDEWVSYFDCFTAQGFEKHIGISGNNYKPINPSECVDPDEDGVLFFTGMAIDALYLLELPDRVDTLTSICTNGGWVDIHDFIPNPYFHKATYEWADACTDTRRVIREPGIYEINMQLKTLQIPITIEVIVDELCDVVRYTEAFPERIDTSIIYCPDAPLQTILLDSIVPRSMAGQLSYVWEDGNRSPSRLIDQAGQLRVVAMDSCYTFPIHINITQQNCQTLVYVPNAFSPNRDGINDEFGPFFNSAFQFKSYEFKIFDRWGHLVFRSNNPNEFWNGYHRDRINNHGVYLWTLTYELDDDTGEKKSESGQVILIR